MADWIDGPPTKTGEYRVVTINASECSGYFDGERLVRESGASIHRSNIVKHAPLDPAPEWLGPERLDASFVGKMIAFLWHDGRYVCGTVNTVKGCFVYLDGVGGYEIRRIERFCQITLPDPAPPAPERDVWEQLLWDMMPIRGINMGNGEQVLNLFRERIVAPLQAENERLKQACKETMLDIEYKECLLPEQWEAQLDEIKQRMRSIVTSMLPEQPAEQASEADYDKINADAARAEKLAAEGKFKTPTEALVAMRRMEIDEMSEQPATPAPPPVVPEPRKFRCVNVQSGHECVGYEFDGRYAVFDSTNNVCPSNWFNTHTLLCRYYRDLEFLPTAPVARKEQA